MGLLRYAEATNDRQGRCGLLRPFVTPISIDW
jgi:hypothetical protein